MMWRRALGVGLFVAWGLACAAGPSGEAEEGPTAEAPKAETPAPVGKATWWVRGEKAGNDALVGAVMDMWGGDPGIICYRGDLSGAVDRAEKAFAGTGQLVSAKTDGKLVLLTTNSPFGDGETSTAHFSTCKRNR